MALIECRRLTRTYRRGENEITPINELDLDVEAGSFLAFMGPSGSGKTTLARFLLLSTVDPPRDAETVEPPAWGLALAGHLPLALVGGATGLIGDP